MELKFRQANKDDFETVYNIVEEAFPPAEIRTKEKHRSLFDRDDYFPFVCLENNKIIGFIFCWKFSGFRFIEHFAIDSKYRGLGVGQKMLKEFIAMEDTDIVLEVEPPKEKISIRRIEFYKRIGFKLNDYFYIQPPLQPLQPELELKIMSYPDALDNKKFSSYTKVIKQIAYNCNDFI